VFAEQYAISGDPVAAYRSAYSRASVTTARVNAARLLRRGDVAAEIERLRAPVREAINQKAILTAEWIVEKLKAEVERKDTTPSARVSALKHLGDHLGLFQVLPPLKVLLAHVSGEYGQAAADLLKQAFAKAAAKAKEQQVSESGKPVNSPEQRYEAQPPAEPVSGKHAGACAPQGSNRPAGPASVPRQAAREPGRGSGPLPAFVEATTTAEGTTGNAGTLLGCRPVTGQGQSVGVGNSEGACESADEGTLAPIRRPTREDDVRGMRCRPGFVPRHGTTADLD
jgi:hypothetical protein